MPTYVELQAQISELQAQAERIRSEERAMIIEDIREKMIAYGITEDDLKATGRAKQTIKAKYRDPDSGKTWTGRGIKPNWLKNALASGKPIEDFKIQA